MVREMFHLGSGTRSSYQESEGFDVLFKNNQILTKAAAVWDIRDIS